MHIYIHIEKVNCDIRLGFSFYARCLLIISARSRRKKERERERRGSDAQFFLISLVGTSLSIIIHFES